MRKLFSFLTIVAVVLSLGFTQMAEARKFGGSKSFGRTYKTAPAQPTQSLNTTNPTLNKQGQPLNSGRGLMGGLLGGLIAGGLFAWLLGSGAFEGIQIFDILMLAGVAFLLFKLLAAKKTQTQQSAQPAFGGAAFRTADVQKEQPATSSTATPNDDIPFNLPAGFDIKEFTKGACDHYRALQDAWNQNNFETIQEYVSPELYNDLKAERENYPGDQHTEVMYVSAEIVRAENRPSKAQLSVLFKGRYRDNVERIEENIDEVWHLERDLTQNDAPWIIVGIENR